MTEPAALPIATPDVIDSALAQVSFAEPLGMEPTGAVCFAVIEVLRHSHYVPLRAVRGGIRRAGYRFTYPTSLGRRSYVAGVALRDEYQFPE